MIRKKINCIVEKKEHVFGGSGSIEVTQLTSTNSELYNHGRCFAHTIIPVGSEIGFHVHNGECEIYHILRGEGVFNDDGKLSPVSAGDVTLTTSGHGHGLKNSGKEDMEIIALILFE